MLTSFYERRGRLLLVLAACVTPILVYFGETLPSNNDLETWLPDGSEVRAAYDSFREEFGGEELILIGVADRSQDDPLIEGVAARLEELPGIRLCWTPSRLRRTMQELSVEPEQADRRLEGLAVSSDRRLQGIVALLSPYGVAHRVETVADVRQALDYCQMGDRVLLAGGPVVISELDRLGSLENNQKFFAAALCISLCLLYYSIRDARLSLAILGLTVWAIELTQAVINGIGGEMNFILTALPVMVMVFTLAISVHLVHYHRSVRENPDAIGETLRVAWPPCFYATLTTVIGLGSLTISDIGPVRQFGLAGSIGCVVSMFTAFAFVPVLLTLWPNAGSHEPSTLERWIARLGDLIVRRPVGIAVSMLTLFLVGNAGLFWVRSQIDPLDFLPRDSRVVSDLSQIEGRLTSVESIEAIVDFGIEDVPFIEKLHRVRLLEDKIGEHPAVRHTMSIADFFPREMPDNPLDAAQLLSRAAGSPHQADYLSAGERYWRISIRIRGGSVAEKEASYQELRALTAADPIAYTGIAPLIEQAQQQIFQGMWESFASAVLIITGIMALALRSLRDALLAMIPNIAPITAVFGLLGLVGQTVDIGMMMTASIALGIAVDGTFHYMAAYQRILRQTGDARIAGRTAFRNTAAPVFEAAAIAAIGMLALTLSSFTPTVRFGWLMAVLLVAATVGDLMLLPALLAIGASRRRTRVPAPQFLRRNVGGWVRPRSAAGVMTSLEGEIGT